MRFLSIVLIVFMAGCCHIPRSGSDLPRTSFVQVFGERGTGSGAVIRNTEDGAFVLTAAHVCAIAVDSPLRIREFTGEVHKELVFIKLDVDNDLCLLFVPDVDIPAVPLAEEAPRHGEKVFAISAPRGFWSPESRFVPITHGVYSGILKGDDADRAVFQLPVTFGSSGGAIVNEAGELVSVVVGIFPFFPSLSVGATHVSVTEFLADTLRDE